MMSILEMQSYIEAMEKNSSLSEEKNFDQRADVKDFIEFQLLDEIDDILQRAPQSDKIIPLKHRVEVLKYKLEDIDVTLFQSLRETVRAGKYRGEKFKNLIHKYINISNSADQLVEPKYDNLDIFINSLCRFQKMPEQTKPLEPEMVYYQKTPARVVFELVEMSHFTDEDVFFDLGSGLGQVAILVNLLTGIKAEGVEFEPTFCDYAKDCAAGLNLTNVTFLNADARKADYSGGTVFFMFTPFTGEILREVLEILKKESLHRKIKIITYGPCTAQVALQSWLEFAAPGDDSIYRLGVFNSF